MDKTVSVVAQMVKGELDDIEVFSTPLLAKQYVEKWLKDSGDDNNWTSKQSGDYLVFTHDTCDEEIIIQTVKVRDGLGDAR